MNTKLLVSIKNLLILILVPCLFFAATNDALAKKKGKKRGKSKKSRVYNPAKTRQLAISTIVNNSQEVSDIAGLQSNPDAILTAANKESIFRKDEEEAQDFQFPEQSIDLETGEVIGDLGEDIAALEAYDDIIVDEERIMSLWSQFIDDSDEDEVNIEEIPQNQTGNVSFATLKKSDMMKKIMGWFGTPYRMGGMGKRAIDCSAFTQAVFYQTANIMIPRTAREQIQIGKSIPKSKLQFGDMIFFHTYSKRFASHVGIYLGDNLFAHASSRFGVTVSSLESTFYTKAYCGARRLRETDMKNLSLKVTANKKAAMEENEEESNQ